MKLIYQITGWMICIWTFSSCARVKTIQYLENQQDTSRYAQVKVPEPTIQKGDLLSITVYSDNPVASAMYNQVSQLPVQSDSKTMQGMPAATSNGAGYLVDGDGDIQMPGIGKIHAEGLTKKLLATQLADEFMKKGLLTNASCDIRFNNFKITLIGEVTKPGVYSIPAERVTILEAVGLAGDLTNFGRKKDVRVIRETDGKREIGKVDLSSEGIFDSPYYFLRQNDVVVVEQDRKKAQANDLTTMRNVSIITSIVTATAVVVTLFRK